MGIESYTFHLSITITKHMTNCSQVLFFTSPCNSPPNNDLLQADRQKPADDSPLGLGAIAHVMTWQVSATGYVCLATWRQQRQLHHPTADQATRLDNWLQSVPPPIGAPHVPMRRTGCSARWAVKRLAQIIAYRSLFSWKSCNNF